jgi:hypothetical protein
MATITIGHDQVGKAVAFLGLTAIFLGALVWINGWTTDTFNFYPVPYSVKLAWGLVATGVYAIFAAGVFVVKWE